MRLLITGGCGFIGSALCRKLVKNPEYSVYNLDALTYAADPASLNSIEHLPNYTFIKGDIRDSQLVSEILAHHEIDAIMHLAAESHVDRSIDGPKIFLETNIIGTYSLLQAATQYMNSSPGLENFRFLHVSTDEVYGDLEEEDAAFCETNAYRPSSPYSASKAASDHLVHAWGRTYNLPVLITNCSNNYGPYQFPEKLIPLMIITALQGKPLPVYGDGRNIRDWLHVEDHVEALEAVLRSGKIGETYNIGGNAERRNIDIVKLICTTLDKQRPRPDGKSYHDQISFVTDRPGHDRRYAINAAKINKQLGWQPVHTFTDGIEKTIRWYLENEAWWKPHLQGKQK